MMMMMIQPENKQTTVYIEKDDLLMSDGDVYNDCIEKEREREKTARVMQ